ncbi:hypothetical protein Vretimale_1661 [Volvox reticuliferus]|uniref:Uncharacterized protein n=1 Tax=Volvox reticuliferus TaxID=1737510 RepID=A0A8J4CV41_9CHLO|nr:hypothetical protein Vretifemale_15541 [Volvox reticuliferus]GIL95688.1 hypothetical protein Vretimale_1661 [Volvox reticuliferus]
MLLSHLSRFRAMRPQVILGRRSCSIGSMPPCVSVQANKRTSVVVRQLSSLRATKGERPDSEKEKSWSEIIEDAADVAKSVFTKIKDTAASLIPSTSEQSAKPTTTEKPKAPLGSFSGGGGLLPNLVGRAMGGLVANALSSLSAQLEEAAREQAGAYEEAVARLQGSAKLRARLGTVTVGPVMSQSSSTSSINGVVTKQVALVMPVYGSLGISGTAQVNLVQGPQHPGGQTVQIAVRTSDGANIVVDDGVQGGIGSRSGRGTVIDVEFREVDKK